MYQDNDGVNHCLLVLCEERDDGIIVESEGSSYARYSAYLPCARKLVQQEQYPSLTAHADEMRWLADKYVQKALNGQLDCQYRIDFDEVRISAVTMNSTMIYLWICSQTEMRLTILNFLTMAVLLQFPSHICGRKMKKTFARLKFRRS